MKMMADVSQEYLKNSKLKRYDVKLLWEWAEKQPHLPSISELEVILFLHSANFSVETAKRTLDLFYTIKTHSPEFSSNRDPCSKAAQEALKIVLVTPLPVKTHENYRVLFCKLLDGNANNFIFTEQLKNFDMNTMLMLMQGGTAEGLIFLLDLKLVAFGHLGKLSITPLKKILHYVQEALPVRLVGVHFINPVAYMEQMLALIKPFLKNEIIDLIHIHADWKETLYKFIPKECLPSEYGGSVGSSLDLQENAKKNLMAHASYLKKAERQVVDESKRPGKPKQSGDVFGIEGSFKKLEID